MERPRVAPFLTHQFIMNFLADHQAEAITGGYMINVSPVVSPIVDVVTINQLNTAVLVSAFGGVNASYSALLTNTQINKLPV